MATLVIGAVGYSLGAGLASGFIGTALGVAGGYIGSRIGGAVDNALGIAPSRTVEGPRLGGLAVQSSAYGRIIPLVYGTARVAGNVIWSTGLIEERTENRQSGGGKGGGGGSVTQVSYTYSASFAVAVAARPIDGVARIWADGKLLRNAAGGLAVGGTVRVYTGREDQDPDPLIEALEGVGNTPAYRGMAYVVFEGLELGEYANRIPNLSFEVIADAGGSASLSTVVRDLSARAGVASVDAGALDEPGASEDVQGFVVGRAVPWRQALEALARAHPFDVAEVDGGILFRPLPRADVATIDRDDVVPHGGGDRRAVITRVRGEAAELPGEVIVRHMDPARDYQLGVQRARRALAADRGGEELELPLVLDGSRAKQVAEVVLARAWMARERISFTVPTRYALLAPGDVISLTLDGNDPLGAHSLTLHTMTVQIEEVETGIGRVMCRGIRFSADVFESAAAADSGAFPPQTIPALAETRLQLLDLPPLTSGALSAATLCMVAASPDANWRGAGVYRSTDGGADYDEFARATAPAVMGVVDGVLGSGPHSVWDEGSSLTVSLMNPDMTLQSRPLLAVLNGANAALVGAELIQFRTATLQGDGRYVLSGLLRGRRGTEHAIDDHGHGEDFVLLTPSTVIATEPGVAAVGKEWLWKGVSFGAPVEDATALPFIFRARNLLPFAPVHLSAGRVDGNLNIRWVRRTRAPGDWIDSADVPLAEEFERYDVDILNNDTVVRSFTVNSPEVTYTAAAQADDFGTVPGAVMVRVYQVSATVGRGYPATAVL